MDPFRAHHAPNNNTSDRYIGKLPRDMHPKPRLNREVERHVPSPQKTPSRQFEQSIQERKQILSLHAVIPLAIQSERHYTPATVLDAPGARDDYYVSVLDWSAQGPLCVGLAQKLFLWAPERVATLYAAPPQDYISTAAFSPDGVRLAVGTDRGDLLVGSPAMLTCMATNTSVACARWHSTNSLCTGTKNGRVLFWDVRQSAETHETHVHRDRLVGMACSSDGVQFATGCNGHLVCLWDTRKLAHPLFKLDHHGSAVRALGFMSNTLVTGGGRQDGQISFVNTASGKVVKNIETMDQVCAISVHYNQILSTHARTNDQMVLWDCKRLDKVVQRASFHGHESRPMQVAQCPVTGRVATMSGDETLKLWDLFDCPKKAAKPAFKYSIR